MSKLEDKLTASIKPGKAAPAAARRPARTASKVAAAPDLSKAEPVVADVRPDQSGPARALHPRRVWPD